MSVRLCRSSTYTQFAASLSKKNNKQHSKFNEARTSFFLQQFRRLPSSTKSVLQRVAVTVCLISFSLLMIYGGPPFLVFAICLGQIQSFNEIIAIAFAKHEITPHFKHNTNYFLLCALFYFWTDNLLIYYHPYVNINNLAKFIDNYYKFISFCAYIIGVIWFVINLQRKYYRRQFLLLAWTHIVLLVIVGSSCLITKTIYEGMIWFVVCVTPITSNDIMAYIVGKLIGKTPLIALSPKKTWEGFIGAGIFTIIISCLVSYLLLDKEHLICPVEYKEINGEIIKVTQCIPHSIFQLANYQFFGYDITLYPFILHTFWLAIFGSVVAPFGGFFASGFKRACNIKDFGASFPGHGGVMDRFDCQLVMIVFINVYISTFIDRPQDARNVTQKLFQRIMNMTHVQQLELFHMLENNLGV